MVESTAAKNLKSVAPQLRLGKRRPFLIHYGKMVWQLMNRTIVECARSMGLHARLLIQFWLEAMNTAAYLISHGLQ